MSDSSRWVRVEPGRMLLTVMPSGATSFETVFAHPAMAARTVLETARPPIGSRTEVEMMLMMRPHPASRIAGSTACTSACLESRWVANAARNPSAVAPTSGPGGGPPALFTRIWTGECATYPSTARSVATGSDKSAARYSWRVPGSGAGSSAQSRWSATSLRESAVIMAPSAARASAAARPMPWLAPQTSARRPAREVSMANQATRPDGDCHAGLRGPRRAGTARSGEESGREPGASEVELGTHPVQRDPDVVHPVRGGPEDFVEAGASGELVLGRLRVAPFTQRLVVGQVWSAATELPRGDPLREHTRKPERVVAEMDRDEELPLAGGAGEVGQDVHEVVMLLVVHLLDPVGPPADPEFTEHGGEVIGDGGVQHAHVEEGMAHQHVEQERGGGSGQRGGEQGGDDLAPVQGGVQGAGQTGPGRPLAEAQQFQVLRGDATSRVGGDHVGPPRIDRFNLPE